MGIRRASSSDRKIYPMSEWDWVKVELALNKELASLTA